MMENNGGPGTIRPATAYIREALRFHDIGEQRSPRILFGLMLAITFAMYLVMWQPLGRFMMDLQAQVDQLSSTIAEGTADSVAPENLLPAFGSILAINLVGRGMAILLASLYQYLYFRRASPVDHPLVMPVMNRYLRAIPTLLLSNLAFYAAVFAASVAALMLTYLLMTMVPFLGILVQLLPFAVLAVMGLFSFRDLTVLDQGAGPLEAFSAALRTVGRAPGARKRIIWNLLSVYLPGFIILLIASGVVDGPAALFFSSFIEVLVLMISAKMAALMYGDAVGRPLPCKPLFPSLTGRGTDGGKGGGR